ncbi:MAG: TetR/AcrR family transcriptional regulator [Hamadaea sp.]|nr:TetR/AcrR family transcriptional regulator [Hamadaea sp.]
MAGVTTPARSRAAAKPAPKAAPGAAAKAAPKAAPKAAVASERRTDLVRIAGDLFAEKGFRATTVREIADAAGILSGSLYHHFDSKESIGDEILSGFLDEVLADYRNAVAEGGDPRSTIEQIVRRSTRTLGRHHAALTMLQRDWVYFSGQPRFAYLRKALREIEQIWLSQLEEGIRTGAFRSDLDPKLTYRLLRDVLWMPSSWRGGRWSGEQIVNGFLDLLFVGITRR